VKLELAHATKCDLLCTVKFNVLSPDPATAAAATGIGIQLIVQLNQSQKLVSRCACGSHSPSSCPAPSSFFMPLEVWHI